MFVDGQALEPEAFGKSFEGKWGPLDSSDVYDNISKVQSPSDTCPNYAEKWSDGVSNASDATNLFDGNTATSAKNTGSGTFSTVTFTPAYKVNKTIKIFADSGVNIRLNGSNVGTFAASSWQTINFSGDLDTLKWSHSAGASGQLCSIEIDGRQLIDGPADNSQVWSEQVVLTLQTSGDGPGNSAFPITTVICPWQMRIIR